MSSSLRHKKSMNNKRKIMKTTDSTIFRNAEIEANIESLLQLLKRHILEMKSETLLVSGFPSSGKTKVLEHIFTNLKTDPIVNDRMTIIRLNGLLHAVETPALQEIASQLDMYLSDCNIDPDLSTVPIDNLQLLLEMYISKLNKSNRCFIIVLNQFEYFAQQKLNSILYALFDTVYADKSTLACYSIITIAVSNRADCLELPEKRLKSRFSNIHIIINAPNSIDFAKDCLQRFGSTRDHSNELMAMDKAFSTYNSLANIEQTLIKMLRCCHDNNTIDDIGETFNRPNTQIHGCLTHLEILLLLIGLNIVKQIELNSGKRIHHTVDSDDEDGNDGQQINDTRITFEQVYNEYSKYILKNQKYFYDKGVVSKAFDRLKDRGLLEKHRNRYMNEKFNDEEILSFSLKCDELQSVLDSTTIPTEIRRYGKMNNI
ncbi:unnamed protein product [Didymodactylos carnosus]|uniref:Origin recognition complex subunit 4 n=1 Tax=Didymodactylos carnosus TaxID=1234261 RepID=A0A813Y2V1_9BILA|nr:unnamed protein product [Didymodactylos carnosus]CAF0876133.1 unnamed protein product [Didymodactylos carnosus]CAF3535625.1 unnamed protein product [Didymodactylos carnosus]CAF3662991.1 unnamed protein product [Didymodactylos carnosus]